MGKSGRTALDMVRDFKPDLVIIDSCTAFDPEVETKNANASKVIQSLRAVTERPFGARWS